MIFFVEFIIYSGNIFAPGYAAETTQEGLRMDVFYWLVKEKSFVYSIMSCSLEFATIREQKPS